MKKEMIRLRKKGKRILSTVLASSMVMLTWVPTNNVFAATEPEFEKLTLSEFQAKFQQDGSEYVFTLDKDYKLEDSGTNTQVALSSTIGSKIKLDLNGYILDLGHKNIAVKDTSFSICDSDSTNTHTGTSYSSIKGGIIANGGGEGTQAPDYDGDGAIKINEITADTSLSIEGATFVKCYSKLNGGVISVENNANFSSDVSIDNCTIDNCSSYANGGAIYFDSSVKKNTLELSDCTIKNCNTEVNGGAIYCCNESSLSLDKCNISNCNTKQFGGAIYDISKYGSVISDKSTIANCYSRQGGGIYTYSKLDIADSTISGCRADYVSTKPEDNNKEFYGGAIYIYGNTANSEVVLRDKAKITNCETKLDDEKFIGCGGGIYAQKSKVYMLTGASIDNCKAQYGAGILNNTANNFYLLGGNITNNTATEGGGGIFITYNSSLTMNKGNITNNHANNSFGGGILSEGRIILGCSDSIKTKLSENPLFEDDTNEPKNVTKLGNIIIKDNTKGIASYTVNNIAISDTSSNITGAALTMSKVSGKLDMGGESKAGGLKCIYLHEALTKNSSIGLHGVIGYGINSGGFEMAKDIEGYKKASLSLPVDETPIELIDNYSEFIDPPTGEIVDDKVFFNDYKGKGYRFEYNAPEDGAAEGTYGSLDFVKSGHTFTVTAEKSSKFAQDPSVLTATCDGGCDEQVHVCKIPINVSDFTIIRNKSVSKKDFIGDMDCYDFNRALGCYLSKDSVEVYKYDSALKEAVGSPIDYIVADGEYIAILSYNEVSAYKIFNVSLAGDTTSTTYRLANGRVATYKESYVRDDVFNKVDLFDIYYLDTDKADVKEYFVIDTDTHMPYTFGAAADKFVVDKNVVDVKSKIDAAVNACTDDTQVQSLVTKLYNASRKEHTHTFSFKAEGNKIIATCTCEKNEQYCKYNNKTDAERSINLTISASENNYAPNHATITIGNEAEVRAWKEVGLTVPSTVTYYHSDDLNTAIDAPKEKGAYIAKVTYKYGNSQSVTASVTFIINDNKTYNDVKTDKESFKDITKTEEIIKSNKNYIPASLDGNKNLKEQIGISDADVKEGTNVWLIVENADKLVSTAEKKLIINNVKENKIACYLDVSLFKKTGEKDAVQITETNGKLNISIELAEELLSLKDLNLYREHENEVSEVDMVKSGNNLMFTADKFSTYVLTYNDDTEKKEFDTYKKNKATSVSKLAKTGDDTTCKNLINNAKKKITNYAYNAKQSLATNKKNIDNVITQLQKDLSKARAARATKNATLKFNAGLKVTQTGSTMNVSWGKIAGVTGYTVYATYCGDSKIPAVYTVNNANKVSTKITKLKGKKLDLKKNVKCYVEAFKKVNGKKQIVAKTIVAHIVGRLNKTYTNVKNITLNKYSYTLKKGAKATIKGKVILVNPKKKQLSNAHAATFRYSTSDANIAVVSSKGVITAKAKGTATLYVYAKNGFAKKITVTVK